MQVRWSEPAFEDLEGIFIYLSQDDPDIARKVVQSIYDACSALESFPKRGRPSRIKGSRELVVQSLPYLVVYEVSSIAVEISRVYHVGQNWP